MSSTTLFPGVSIREIDKSDYLPRLATTILGLVGVANRGPLHTPTLITNEEELIQTFGDIPDPTGGNNERQLVSISGAPTGGTFKLTFLAQETGTIAYNATAAVVQTALRALPAIGSAGCNVTGNPGGPWTIEFTNTLGNRNVNVLTVTTPAFTGGTSPAATVTTLVAGTSPPGDFSMHGALFYLREGRQLLFTRTCQYSTGSGWLAENAATPTYVDGTTTGAPAGACMWDRGSEEYAVTLDGATAGQFKLVFNAITSADIAFNATAADVQAALVAMSSIGAGNVLVTGVPGGPFSVKMTGTLAGTNHTDMTIAAGTTPLSGGGGGQAVTATITGDTEKGIIFTANSPGEWANDYQIRFVKVDGRNSNEKQLIDLRGATSGQFKITYAAVQSGDIAVTATAAQVQTALEAISTIGTGNVSVTASGLNFLVEFINVLSQTDIATMTIQDGTSAPTGGGGTEYIVEYTKGGIPVPSETVYRVDILAPIDITSSTMGVRETYERVMLVDDQTTLETYNAYSLYEAMTNGIRNYRPKSAFLTVVDTDFPAILADVRDEIATTADGTTGVTFSLGNGYSALNTAGGTTGEYQSAYIGTEVDTLYGTTALQTFANPQKIDVNLLAVCGVTDSAVLTELTRICESRQDCMCIIDPPPSLTYQGVIAWHNKTGEWASLGHKPNSSYAALYWPHVTVYDPYNRIEVTLPPSCFIPAQIAYSDQQTAPWFAPAGLKRGRINAALSLETETPSQGALESMYSGGNCINVIVNFRNEGITIMGQKTTQRRATVLDRIAPRRMLLYLEKVVASSIRVIVFDPHDEQTRSEFINVIRPICEQIKNSRGLYDYQLICDETINTPDVIDRSELKGVILLKPVKAAEFINVDFVLNSTGATFSVPAEVRT